MSNYWHKKQEMKKISSLP